jgi:hypothetical protein
MRGGRGGEEVNAVQSRAMELDTGNFLQTHINFFFGTQISFVDHKIALVV